MTIKYLAGNRLTGSNVERTGAIWNQTSESGEFAHNDYVTVANISPVASTDVIGKVLKKFTLKMKNTASPLNSPITWGVWARDNTTRGSPDTEFECTSHTLTNMNQLTTTYDIYTFEPKSPATGHTLVALDSVGYLQDTDSNLTETQLTKRANFDSTDTNMSSCIWFNSVPVKWDGNDTNQCPTSTGYGTEPDWSDLDAGAIYSEWDTGDHYIWSGSAWNLMS